MMYYFCILSTAILIALQDNHLRQTQKEINVFQQKSYH